MRLRRGRRVVVPTCCLCVVLVMTHPGDPIITSVKKGVSEPILEGCALSEKKKNAVFRGPVLLPARCFLRMLKSDLKNIEE